MPAVVINNLRALMQLELNIPNQPSDIVLGETGCPDLPDAAYDLLDKIHDAARNVFGGMQLTRAQETAMEQSGFPVLWRRGVIVTAKGCVRYKP